LTTFALLSIGSPASAHTPDELNAWLLEWDAAYEWAVVTQADTGALFFEYDDMRERHPHWDGTLISEPTPTPARSESPEAVQVVAEPAPVPPEAHGAGVEQWRSLVASYFAADKVEIALCIMNLESRGDPNAKNSSSTAAGLFQFLQSTWDNMVPSDVTGGSYASGQVYNPEANVRAAAWLQAAAGWSQWSPWKRGACH
jgi:hypothetical protein